VGVVCACGGQGALTADHEMDAYIHLFMTNRGLLITPFHNMALCCPTTTAADVDFHTSLFEEAVCTLKAAAASAGPAPAPKAKL
jgi:glutamate-1-semialdehyde 2,1-aminomutase